MTWRQGDPIEGENLGLVEVPFTNRSYPGWRFVVSVTRWFDKASTNDPDAIADTGVAVRLQERGVRWERYDPDAPDLPARVRTRFPVKSSIASAIAAVRELEYDFLDQESRPPLPPGHPIPKADNEAWYRQFGRAVLLWRALGLSLTAIFQEIAVRKSVEPPTVKTWWQKAQRVLDADEKARPAESLGACAACAGPIAPGVVGVTTRPDGTRELFHAMNCARREHRRMVIDRNGEVTPL